VYVWKFFEGNYLAIRKKISPRRREPIEKLDDFSLKGISSNLIYIEYILTPEALGKLSA
jgi:hypothetical protein